MLLVPVHQSEAQLSSEDVNATAERSERRRIAGMCAAVDAQIGGAARHLNQVAASLDGQEE